MSAQDRECRWCGERTVVDPRSKYCGKLCRQRAWKLRQRIELERHDAQPLRLAYADPPYPGTARYYRREESYAGEVDHAELIARLASFDGWALSTSARALRDVLPLCPEGVRVCAWCKPNPVARESHGLHGRWEPVIVMQARRMRPGRADYLVAAPAQRGGDDDLIGRKPQAFCAWLFGAMGALPGDDLADLYPGTGMVMRAWRAFSDVSPGSGGDASPDVAGDGSPVDQGDASLAAGDDVSSSSSGDRRRAIATTDAGEWFDRHFAMRDA